MNPSDLRYVANGARSSLQRRATTSHIPHPIRTGFIVSPQGMLAADRRLVLSNVLFGACLPDLRNNDAARGPYDQTQSGPAPRLFPGACAGRVVAERLRDARWAA
jgi:hypothetical protein